MNPETKGDRAKDILESEVYQEAVEGAKRRIKDRWAGEPSEESRNRLWHKLQAINAVTDELNAIMGHGAKARHDRLSREKREAASVTT